MHIMPSNHRKVIILLAPLAALCLSACGNSSVEAIKPPPEKLTCAGEPPVPEGAITDAVVGDYMVAQRAAWFDCHSTIDWLRNFFAGLEERRASRREVSDPSTSCSIQERHPASDSAGFRKVLQTSCSEIDNAPGRER